MKSNLRFLKPLKNIFSHLFIQATTTPQLLDFGELAPAPAPKPSDTASAAAADPFGVFAPFDAEPAQSPTSPPQQPKAELQPAGAAPLSHSSENADAEVARLKSEVSRLEKVITEKDGEAADECSRLESEVDRLMSEIEKLKLDVREKGDQANASETSETSETVLAGVKAELVEAKDEVCCSHLLFSY